MSIHSAQAPLVVLEGIDGSGKGTQSARLLERARSSGLQAELLSFPRYSSTFFGARIAEFLNGELGPLEQLPPFLVSLLYAGDRFESRSTIHEARQGRDLVICDRYTPSNIAHQASKSPPDKRDQVREWIEHVEYTLFDLPKPELVILLDLPVSASQELIARKQKRDYTDRVADLQEADTVYLQGVRELYLELAANNSRWHVVSVMSGNDFRSLDEIGEEIWELTQTRLALRKNGGPS